MRRIDLRPFLLALTVSLFAVTTAMADDEGERSNPPVKHDASKQMPDTVIATEKSDIALLDRVAENGSYSTWLRAIDAAGLRDTFADGTYTIFAPSDEAWSSVPVEVVDWLMLPENKDYLTQVVNYSIYTGDLPSTKLRTVKTVKTIGGDVDIIYKDGVTRYGTSRIVSTKPLVTKYGTVYTTDTVLFPRPVLTVLEKKGYTVTYEKGSNWGRVVTTTTKSDDGTKVTVKVKGG
jgi:uncharacterized surface protein with fasciclin (FAS1) repeats